jgi:DNA primase
MYDRDAVLAAVDLRQLADELLGGHRGSDHSPMWSCPNPEHSQTGRTPPVSVFTTRWGEQRWRCHGCGNGGSAVDLVMQVRGVGARDALAGLAQRVGIPELEPGAQPERSRPRAAHRHRAASPALSPRAMPELDRYVSQCSATLWRPEGAAVRQWLTKARGLPENIIRANRVGADLGAGRQARPDGIPHIRCASVVLPVLADGGVCYVQLRTLGARRGAPRYLNPSSKLAPNPRLGVFDPVPNRRFPFAGDEVLVTEGIIDAFSATAAGYRAAAVLGASYSDPVTAIMLARVPGRLVIAFDPDPAGRAGADQLARLMRGHRRDVSVLDLKTGDLNQHLIEAADWQMELPARIQYHTLPRSTLGLALAR